MVLDQQPLIWQEKKEEKNSKKNIQFSRESTDCLNAQVSTVDPSNLKAIFRFKARMV